MSILDHKTRQSHADMHGVIKPINDKFWDINYPPNGFNCRCCVMFLTSDSLKARGWKPYSGTFPNIADKGFRKHGGKPYSATLKRLDNETNRRIKENDKLIRKELSIKNDTPKIYDIISSKNKEKNLEPITDFKTAVAELLINKNKKANIPPIRVGFFSEIGITNIKKELNLDLSSNEIFITKNQILHAREERKGKYNQNLETKYILNLVSILEDKKTKLTIDLKNKNINFWKKISGRKALKATVHLNYKLNKLKSNHIITLSKVNSSDIKGKQYKIIKN